MRVCFPIASDDKGAQLRMLLCALVLLNERALKRTPLPSLYASGVRYRPEGRGKDNWRQAPDVYRTRHGDCEDLSTWRAAELRVTGEDPGARADCRQNGRGGWHAIVVRGDGSIEDPSRRLGMGRRGMAGMAGGPMEVVRWHVKKTADGWIGVIEIPEAALAWIARVPKQAGPKSALTRAAAHSLASLQSPIMQAILPPQAQLALKALPKAAGIARKIASFF